MDFQGMKRKKLQALCKKHGIPANLKNIEMANRLATLSQDQTSPVRFKSMSDILSRCSVIESQRDGASVDDESLVRMKTDETLVTSEYNTVQEEDGEEREIGKEGCMSVVHCVSNPESELSMPTETELLSENRHGDGDLSERVLLLLGDYGLDEEGKQEEHTATESPDESDGLNTSQNEAVRTGEEVAVEFPEEASKSEENKALELRVDCDHFISANKNGKCRHDMSNVVTSSEPHTAGKQGLDELEFKDESAFFTRFETCLLLGESTQDRFGNSKSFASHHDSSPKLINDNLLPLDLGENTFSDSSGSIASKVDSVTDIEGADTIMECNPEPELFVETTPSPSLVHLAVSLPTGPILVKETVSTLIAEDDLFF
ncbi:Uncharacterized protein Rs2_34711 [Raphanus sativus]|nr:Uncharacterized protein Rs2_34711 [Raphanus sativus]